MCSMLYNNLPQTRQLKVTHLWSQSFDVSWIWHSLAGYSAQGFTRLQTRCQPGSIFIRRLKWGIICFQVNRIMHFLWLDDWGHLIFLAGGHPHVLEASHENLPHRCHQHLTPSSPQESLISRGPNPSFRAFSWKRQAHPRYVFLLPQIQLIWDLNYIWETLHFPIFCHKSKVLPTHNGGNG